MTTNTHDVGDLVRCTGTFTDSASVAVDPTTTTFNLKAPNGTITTYVYVTDAEVVKDSTGIYHVDVNVQSAGTYYFQFKGTGSNQAAEEAKFYAEQPEIVV